MGDDILLAESASRTQAVIGVKEDNKAQLDQRIGLTLSATDQPIILDANSRQLFFTVPANDTPTLIISPDALELREGSSAAIIISASATPIDVIAFSLTTPTGGSLSAEDLSPNLPVRIELSPRRPATEIAIVAISDNIAELPESGALVLPKLSGFAQSGAPLRISIPANDTPTVTAGLPELIAEGGAGILMIEAQRPPAATAVIRIRAEGEGAARVLINGAPMSNDILLAESASRTQAIIEVKEDNKAQQFDQQISLTLSAADQPIILGANSGRLFFTVPANDTPTLSITPDALTFKEGNSATIAVSANPAPIDVIILSLNAPTGDSLSAEDLLPDLPLRIELDPRQPVTNIPIAAIPDNMPEPFESGALTLRKLSGFASAAAATLTLSVPANDTPILTVSPRALELREGSSAAITITVPATRAGRITLRPMFPVSVLSVKPPSITINPEDHAATRALTVTAAEDLSMRAIQETHIINLEVTGLAEADPPRIPVTVQSTGLLIRIRVYLEGALK